MHLNQTVWITGASSGIGAALSLKYSKENYFVILSGRNGQKLKEIQSRLSNPTLSDIITFDVSDLEQCQQAVLDIKSKFGCPKIIILNAGVSQRALASETTASVSKEIIFTNLLANIAITKSLFPDLIAEPRNIVVISSVAGKVGPMLRSTYAASKHGLHGYFDSLRAENYKHELKVTLVCPGYIHTDISLNALTADGSKQGTMDNDTKNGISPEKLAIKIFKAQQKNKSEIYIGGAEIVAIYLKRFFPKMLESLIRKSPPK